jgi:hypothetical protein
MFERYPLFQHCLKFFYGFSLARHLAHGGENPVYNNGPLKLHELGTPKRYNIGFLLDALYLAFPTMLAHHFSSTPSASME